MIVRVIDSVSAGCYSLSNSATEVLRQLGDVPLYLQTHENSIQEYKARYGSLPIMPLSSTFTYLRNLDPNDNDDCLMPEHNVGDPKFKMMYGTRKLLGQPKSKFTIDDAPGIRANLASFNGAASDREKIDVGRYGSFLARIVTGLRFIVDTRNYRGILSEKGAGAAPLRASLVATDAAGATNANNIAIIAGGAQANAAYSIQVTPQNAISTTESSYQDQELRKISEVVGGSVVTLGQDRRHEWVMNIIDMNIIPVNVHALMRGIPFAPLYNYVYTFEQMVCLMFGESVEKISQLDLHSGSANPPANTIQMWLKMTINPYGPVADKFYGNSTAIHPSSGANGFMTRLFRGDDSFGAGRPKFQSDQLFNKSLFGTLVDTPYVFDEGGPSSSGRMASTMRYAPQAATFVGVDPTSGPTTTQAEWGTSGANRRAAARGLRYPNVGLSANANQFGALTYLGEPDKSGDPSSALKVVQMGANAIKKMQHLEAVGKARFDTRLVRNLMLITNIQRVMRLKLSQELTQYRNVLVKSHSVVNRGVTEYGYAPPIVSTRTTQGRRRVGLNETATDRVYDNERRLL